MEREKDVMKLDVIISADHIDEALLEGKNIVIIDMLRATSVIVTALANGASKVIPFLTVEEALERGRGKDGIILGGERRALKIEGFNLSNSPLEYSADVVGGKEVILTTTNGTRAINRSKKADKIFIGSMLNAAAVVERLLKLNNDVVFVNAGTVGQFSLDDFICSGYMISMLSNYHEQQLSDIAFTAKYIYENNKNIVDYIKNARHYEVLKSLNLEGDINYCSQKDIFSIVPEYKNGEIKISIAD